MKNNNLFEAQRAFKKYGIFVSASLNKRFALCKTSCALTQYSALRKNIVSGAPHIYIYIYIVIGAMWLNSNYYGIFGILGRG